MPGALAPCVEGRTAHPVVCSLTTVCPKLGFSHRTAGNSHTAHAEVKIRNCLNFHMQAIIGLLIWKLKEVTQQKRVQAESARSFLGVRYTARKQNNLETDRKKVVLWRFRVWNAAFATDSSSAFPSSIPDTPMCSPWSELREERRK